MFVEQLEFRGVVLAAGAVPVARFWVDPDPDTLARLLADGQPLVMGITLGAGGTERILAQGIPVGLVLLGVQCDERSLMLEAMRLDAPVLRLEDQSAWLAAAIPSNAPVCLDCRGAVGRLVLLREIEAEREVPAYLAMR